MIDRKMNRMQLKEASQISGATIAKLGKDDLVSMKSILKICRVLNCDIGDIVEVVHGDE